MPKGHPHHLPAIPRVRIKHLWLLTSESTQVLGRWCMSDSSERMALLLKMWQKEMNKDSRKKNLWESQGRVSEEGLGLATMTQLCRIIATIFIFQLSLKQHWRLNLRNYACKLSTLSLSYTPSLTFQSFKRLHGPVSIKVIDSVCPKVRSQKTMTTQRRRCCEL